MDKKQISIRIYINGMVDELYNCGYTIRRQPGANKIKKKKKNFAKSIYIYIFFEFFTRRTLHSGSSRYLYLYHSFLGITFLPFPMKVFVESSELTPIP